MVGEKDIFTMKKYHHKQQLETKIGDATKAGQKDTYQRGIRCLPKQDWKMPLTVNIYSLTYSQMHGKSWLSHSQWPDMKIMDHLYFSNIFKVIHNCFEVKTFWCP